MESSVSFGSADYVTMAIMLTVSLAIGAFFGYTGRHKTTQEEYMLGGRQLGVIPVCLSLFATFNSAVSLLGTPADVYTNGTMMIYVFVSISLANTLCIWTLLPLVYPLRVTSLYQYLQMRFESNGVRLIGASMGMLSSIAYMTIAILSPALALQTAAGLPLWVSLLAVGGIGTLYTTIGGIKSVVWTDVFQSLIMFSGIIATLIKACIEVGGPSAVWTRTTERGRLILDESDLDPRVRHTLWGTLIGSTTYWLSVNFSQSFSQRICSTKSQRDAKLVISLVAPLNFIYGAILVFTGMTILVYFDFIGCDPLAVGFINNPNQLMPYFVIRTLGFIPGLSGLYIATIFSGALSTLSSGINSLAANTVEDLLKPLLRNARESTVTAILKLTVAIYGCGIIGLAYLVKEAKGPLTQLIYTAMGASGGPVFGLFLLGGAFPQANKVGASIGCFIGLVFGLWLNLSKFLYGSRPPILPPGPTNTCHTDDLTTGGRQDLTGNGTTPFKIILDDSWVTTIAPSLYKNHTSSMSGFTELVGTTDIENSTVNSLYGTRPTPKNNYDKDSTFHLYDLSYLWLPLMGTLVSVVAGVFISNIYELVTKTKTRPRPDLLFPFVRRFYDYKNEDGIIDEEDKEMGIALFPDVNKTEL